ncbi:DUF3147 family protein [Desulfosudis oleivorans]|uniref:Conserved hypothetical membrane protein n=1 Tax=Desulfosudis oleivorans (strain DSM 6200 / JCM 39069 / Hxd3) TaxID=96561 RepID=A8ZVV8_DESOH|nr:DUF3147 family protein [Desulfosudis oleivorans]ABW66667.1 conserved hypothetical membrane protein [Desulfosudis oleivorans Hxd3]
MQLLVKVIISLAVILIATGVGKKLPSMAGLIGVMPLTGALVLVWIYLENQGDPAVMQPFTRGAIFGMIPTVLFFLTALVCFKNQFSLPATLAAGFGVWLIAALVHQWILS